MKLLYGGIEIFIWDLIIFTTFTVLRCVIEGLSLENHLTVSVTSPLFVHPVEINGN